MDVEDAGPDRNRLHDLVRLKWDEAQVDGASEHQPVSDEQIAEGGPYSVDQIREHLTAERDSYVVEQRDDGTLLVVSVQ